VQGTVAHFDPEHRSGELLLDNGERVEIDAAAFEASGLRLLRLGQRVQIELNERGVVHQLALPTLPPPR
jgi:2-phospho-L-lactate/phosphoenolpyruvate guanylyltransferase